MNKAYKRYRRYLNTQGDITLPYLKRTIPALKSFIKAWYHGNSIREEYFESEPPYIIKTLHLPIHDIRGVNHIPKHIVPLMYSLATLLQCRLIYSTVISQFNVHQPQNTVKIVGPEENVLLCLHILQRTVIDLIKARVILIDHYKKKNKHLFGKQKQPHTKALTMISHLVLSMRNIIGEEILFQQDFIYHRYSIKLTDKKISEYFKTTGYISPKRGFSRNKIINDLWISM